jgi:phenylpropionate dioxygenase-like ring-hydroxylating dioxygenase large terminal subunit
MLINLWYVAEWSDTVKDKPVKVKMLGQNFVLFRDQQGKVSCLSDVCLHRGGSLSGGRTIRDCVACPYHGWQFNGDGKVEFIPSEGGEFKIPDRARVDAYPTEERYGMIWVFLGDIPESERIPIPEFPEYSDTKKWRAMHDNWDWKAEAARVVENGIDIAHASFVHPMFGYEETAQENHIKKVEFHDYWARSWNEQYPPELTGGFLNWRKLIRSDRQPTETIPTWYMAGMVVRIQINLNPSMSIIMFDANTPVDEHNTRTFAVQLRSFVKHPIFDASSRKRLHKIFREDQVILEQASPNYLPETLANELSVKDDRFMSLFRRARRGLIEENGWQIDSATVNAHEGRKSFAIPSPFRRERTDLRWVMDAVPLVPPMESVVKLVDQAELS